MFTCTARDAKADAWSFSKVFKGAPLAGMPCGGEVGPRFRSKGSKRATQVGEVALQGFTAVYGLFALPIRKRERSTLFFEDVDAAFAEARRQPGAVATAQAATAAHAHAIGAEEGGEDDEDDSEGMEMDEADWGEEESDEYEYDHEDDDDDDDDDDGEDDDEEDGRGDSNGGGLRGAVTVS